MLRVRLYLLLCAAILPSVARSAEFAGETRRFSSMHAVVDILVPTNSRSTIAAATLADTAENEIRRLSSLLSPRGEHSDIERLNRAAPGEWVEVDPLTLRVTIEAQRWHRMTEGLFDPTIGPLKKQFQFDGKTLRRWPSEEELREAKGRVGAEKLLVDREGCRLSWAAPGMTLDLGGIAKGFAADVAAELLTQAGVENALIDVGGEMRVLGSRPDPEPRPWAIGLTNPRGKNMAYMAEVTSRAIATSGDYQSYFEYDGKRYSHIIDPRSGLPLPEKVAGATVSHPDSATSADALATVMCILGSQRGAEFIERNWREAGLAGVDVILFEMDDDGDMATVSISVDQKGAVSVDRP